MNANTPVPELNPLTGELWLPAPAFAALTAYLTSEDAAPDASSDAGRQLGLLRRAGVFDGTGQPHPALSEAAAAIAAPSSGALELSYGGTSMRGWAGSASAALLLPADGDGRHKLTGIPLSWLPDALARLVDLSPRARPETEHAPRPPQPAPYEEGMFEQVRRHWRLRFDGQVGEQGHRQGSRPSEGSTTSAALEVVDTENGFWVLSPGPDGSRIAHPASPATVWRLVVQLLTHPPDFTRQS